MLKWYAERCGDAGMLAEIRQSTAELQMQMLELQAALAQPPRGA